MRRAPYWPTLSMRINVNGSQQHGPVNIVYPPPVVYKYVDAEHAHFLEAGNLKIGSLRSYGLLESGRADDEEGTATMHLNEAAPILPGSDIARRLLASGAIDVRGPIGGAFNVRVIMRCEDLYCLCFSLSSEAPDNGREQAVFEVTDLRTVIERLSIVHPQLGSWFPGNVSYESRHADFRASHVLPPNPFTKSERFAWEREARVIWKPSQSGDLAALAAPDPEIASLLRRIR